MIEKLKSNFKFEGRGSLIYLSLIFFLLSIKNPFEKFLDFLILDWNYSELIIVLI